MQNTIPKRYLNNIEERPVLLSSRIDSQKYDDLAKTLDIMEASKAVILDVHEALVLFGKAYAQTIRAQMKKRGIRKTRIATQDKKVHIWTIKV